MRPLPSFLFALTALAALAACGTKTALSLPPAVTATPTTPPPPAPSAAVDNTNKAAAESRK